MAVLKFLGSRQMRRAPFFLSTTTMELIHGVGLVTSAMMPCWTMLLRVSLRQSLSAKSNVVFPFQLTNSEDLGMSLEEQLFGHWVGS